MNTTKVCSVCREDLQLGDFYPDKRHSDGRQSCCKECRRNKERPNATRKLLFSPVNGGKVCSVCHVEKSEAEFNKERRKSDGLCARCKSCDHLAGLKSRKAHPETQRAKSAAWEKANPGKSRARALRSLYGISPEEFEQMQGRQGSKCAICDRPETAKNHRTGKVRNLAVDHNHKSGRVRGLLCGVCNNTIGIYEKCKEEPKWEAYLKKYN